MRNLKRALSLTLASVMLLGMMVVGSSAAGYSDVDDNDNVEAIEVLQAIEVMVGDAGSTDFRPDEPVKRAEMAVVMGKLLNLNYNYYSSTCPFSDVSGNYDWAKGWVGAAYANKILSGRSADVFDPGAYVTAVEAASMMMRALGYFKYTEDIADGFQLATVRQGNQIGIFNGIGTDATTPMTRNQVAQMALNALRSNIVDFTGTPGIEVNGVKVGYRAEYTPRTSPEAKYNAIADLATTILTDNGQYYVQLGEELYDGDLRLNDNSTDDFGRPSRYWEYDGKAIGTYMKKEIIREEYSDKVTGKMLYELLTKDVVDSISRGRSNDYTLSIAIDGEEREAYLTNKGGNYDSAQTAQNFYFDIGKIVRGNTDAVGGTGKGVLTQVFVDTAKKTVDIAIINTYLAQANEDYASRQDKVTFTVYAVEDITAGSDIDLVKNTRMNTGHKAITASLDASGEDFDVKDVKKDDIYLVTVAEGAIQTLTKPEVLSETSIDAFKKTSNVTVAGQKYDYANTAKYDDQVLDNYTGEGSTNLKDKTYNVYLDKYGYAIGVEEVDGADNYVFITGYDGDYSFLSNKTADMGAIFPDGRFEVIKVKTNSNNSSPYLFAKDTATSSNLFAAKGATAPGTDTNGNGVVDTEEDYNAAIVNTWCTYTVNDAGEYSLTIVDGTNTPKANQSRQSVTGANKLTIDTKRVQLTGADGKYVFANDQTAFINTELDYISIPGGTGGTTHHGTIISDVESVTTGVRNVNLEVTDKTAKDASTAQAAPSATNFTPIYEVYTLYNTDRDIIAVVTLDAEDSGANSVYAYVTSSNVTEEAYSSADKEYTWSREVVIDGEITNITYKGDKLDKIGTTTQTGAMAQGKWYELKLNADGHVRKAVDVTAQCSTVNTNKYQSTVASVVPAWNNSTTVEILHDQTTVTKLTFSEGTLWTREGDPTGISVATDVKVVVCNANDAGTSNFDSVEDGYTGYSGLTNALNDLNNNFTGDVSAVYDGGRAKVLILNCTAAKPTYDGGNNQGNNNQAGKVALYSGKLYVDSSITDEVEQATAIEAWLLANNYTNVDVSVTGTTINVVAKKGTITFKWDNDGSGANNIDDSKTLVAIKVNGVGMDVPNDATVAAVTGTTSNAKNFVMETSTTTTKAVATSGTVVAGEDYGTDAYVEYQATAPTAPSTKWTVSDLSATVVTAKKAAVDTKFVKIGSTVSYKLTSAGAVTQAKDAATVTTQYSLTLAGASFNTTGCTYTNWKYTAADGKLETQLAAGNGTNDVTYIGATDTIIVSVTVPTSAEVTNASLKLTEADYAGT